MRRRGFRRSFFCPGFFFMNPGEMENAGRGLFAEGQDLAARSAAASAILTAIPDPQARFAWLVEQARSRPLLPPALRRDEFLVPGCLVRLWWVPELRDGRCWFQLDSDAVSLKAVAGLICDFYSGQPPVDVRDHRPAFLEELSLGTNLAESRRRTVWRVRELIRDFATRQIPAV